jgi:hypothetical protein
MESGCRGSVEVALLPFAQTTNRGNLEEPGCEKGAVTLT